MPETVLAQHPPAVKVGGRRLSITTKPKSHAANGNAAAGNGAGTNNSEDYPRPAAPGDGQEHTNPPHTEEEAPKKEKKHVNHDEWAKKHSNKSEGTRPTRDLPVGGKSYGAGGRIAQPAGKGFAA